MDGNGHVGDAIRSTWTLEEVRALFGLPFNDLMYRAQVVHRPPFRSERGAALDAAVDQDRRLPRGLRVLPAGVRYDTGLERRGADVARRGASTARAQRARQRRDALLHGRGVAQSRRTATSSTVLEMVEGVRALGHRDLRDARHARRRGQAEQLEATPGSTTTTTTSTRRASYYGKIITHAHLRGPPRHARARARRRHQRLLRRHRRHGRDAAATASALLRSSRTSTRIPRACRSTSSCRSRARRSHGAEALDPFEFVRIDRGRAHPDAARARAAVGRPQRDERRACRRCASSPARTRSSTARSC